MPIYLLHFYKKKRNLTKGFSLIDMLMAIAIGLLLSMGSYGAVVLMHAKVSQRQSAATVYHAFEEARSRSINSVGGVPHGVRVNAGEVIIYSGSAYAGSGEKHSLVGGSSTNKNGADVTFGKLNGEASTPIDVIVTHSLLDDITISVSQNGAIMFK